MVRWTILIVEDEFLVAYDMQDMLQSLDCMVAGPVASIEEALDVLEAEPIDGALLDINIGGREVFPLADRLQERDIPFAFSTGYEVDSVIPARFADRPLLRKPYDEKKVAEIVKGLFPPDARCI